MIDESSELKRRQSIASIILGVEKAFPGSVNLKHNPSLVESGIQQLKQLGYRKPIFLPAVKFLVQTVFGSKDVLTEFLPRCLLFEKPLFSSVDEVYVWTGDGTCAQMRFFVRY